MRFRDKDAVALHKFHRLAGMQVRGVVPQCKAKIVNQVIVVAPENLGLAERLQCTKNPQYWQKDQLARYGYLRFNQFTINQLSCDKIAQGKNRGNRPVFDLLDL